MMLGLAILFQIDVHGVALLEPKVIRHGPLIVKLGDEEAMPRACQFTFPMPKFSFNRLDATPIPPWNARASGRR